MTLRRNGFLHRLLMIMFAIGAFEGAAYAQFSVTITGPGFTSTTAPSGSFIVSAAVSGIPSNQVSKVVFYRNDVPYKTFTSGPFELPQDQLGQDTYTYRARAYSSAAASVDSGDFKLTVHTARVVKMGDLIPTEVGTYSHELSNATCDSQCNPATKLAQFLELGGTVYVKDSFTLNSTVTVLSGSQIVGAPNATLTLNANNTNLFLINAPVGSNALPRTSGVVIRDVKLKTTGSGNTGIAIVGDASGVGVSSDLGVNPKNETVS